MFDLDDQLNTQSSSQPQDDQNNTTQATNDVGSANTGLNFIDAADFFRQFEDRIFEEIGLASLNDEMKNSYRTKIEKLINDRLINVVLALIPEDKVSELNQKIESGQPSPEILDYIKSLIPNFDDIAAQELVDLKDDLVKKMKE